MPLFLLGIYWGIELVGHMIILGFPGGSTGKESACNAGDPGSIPRLGRSPREENGHPLQYSCLGNPKDREAWWAIVHEVTRVWHNLVAKSLPPPYDSSVFNILSKCQTVFQMTTLLHSHQQCVRVPISPLFWWVWSGFDLYSLDN